jgi:hypothetical protein
VSRARSALLWGLIGALAFLVLAQGYRLFVGPLGLDIPIAAGLGLCVGGVVTAVSYVVEPRLETKGRT